MKLNRILSAALASVCIFAACQKVEVASGDATVGFSSAEFESGLGTEYIYIPVVTTGTTSVYPIKVTVEVEAYSGDYAAVEDVDYMITSKEILVASAESKPTIEVKIVNPEDADELRFALKIVSQENAQKISQQSVLVKCAKSELDRICGNWTATGYNQTDAQTETWKIFNEGGAPCISGMFGETAGYMSGVFEDGKIIFEIGDVNNALAAYNFNIGTHFVVPVDGVFEDGKIIFEIGDVNNALNAYNFTGLGPHYIVPIAGIFMNGKTYLKRDGQFIGTISEDYKTITWTFPDGYDGFALGLYTYPDGAQTDYFYDTPFMLTDNKITKQPKK